MDVSQYGVVELSDAELLEIRGGCEFFCAVLKRFGAAYQNTKEAIEAAAKYVEESDTGGLSYYTTR